jgi:hypothetical protein
MNRHVMPSVVHLKLSIHITHTYWWWCHHATQVLAALQVGAAATVQSVLVRHKTHALLRVLHFGVAAAAAQLASDVHVTHLLTLAVSATVLHCVVVDPVTMQAALSVAVHWTQRFVTVLHTGVAVRVAHCVEVVHSAKKPWSNGKVSYKPREL